MEPVRELIDFGVACFERWHVKGIAMADLPATPASEAYYVIYIYISDVPNPVMIPYTNVEERNAKYEEFKGML